MRDTQPDAKEEAVMLLEAWRKFEQQTEAGAEGQQANAVAAVEKRMPKKIKRKRPIETDDGSNVGMEVYPVLCRSTSCLLAFMGGCFYYIHLQK